MKTIKIFLASSSKFESDRQEFEILHSWKSSIMDLSKKRSL
ncbi:MAG: hypothetical protein AAF383_02360 [Cyanobacteria bacterium P01_A01_bin.83]